MDVRTIYGPPGTGKTTELLRLLEIELETYAPEEIAYVSFTKEGSEQGKKRAIASFGFGAERFPNFRTLHSMAFQELKMNRDSVMDKSDYREYSAKVGMSFTGYYTEELKNDDDQYLFFDELHRNNPRTAATYLAVLNIDKLRYVRRTYQQFKQAHSLYDFTDMIEQYVTEARTSSVKIAFIDEAQDLTTLQWKMIWTAFRHCDTIYIAGDDDQAIYQWSGADVDYFLSVEGTPSILHHSYRLPDSVLAFAKRISSQISRRIEKNYTGRGKDGDVLFHNSIESIPVNSDETWMLLVRNHAFMPKLAESLARRGLVYSVNGTPSVTKEDITLIERYEQVRKTSMMTQQEEVRLQKALKSKYDLRMPWYDSFNWGDEKIAYMRDIVRLKPEISNPKIRIATIHSSKGGEADNVVLDLDITKNVAANLARNPDSEHRAFYVGATRAKKVLHVLYGSSRNTYPLY